MSGLRIIHTESSKGWGGQENRTLNELIGMRERGHHLAVVCQPGARLAGRAREAGFEVFEVAMRGALDLPALLNMRRIFRNFAADIVNTHSGRDTQLAGMAARSLFGQRPRIVRTRHLALAITSQFSYSVLPDHVVSVSRFVGNYLASAGVPAAMITTVPTGIDLTRYVREASLGKLREELGLAPETLLVGTVAILRVKKGHADLLEAAQSVLKAMPDVHFVFAGDGPQQANLERRIGELGLGERVHLLGLRRDVANVLASLDLFVLPTHQEALGTAFVEAGAMLLPVIGSDVDGVPEVIADNESGLLVPAKNPAALASAILELLGDPARRQQMGLAGRLRVEQQFSRSAMAAGMEALYQRLRSI